MPSHITAAGKPARRTRRALPVCPRILVELLAGESLPKIARFLLGAVDIAEQVAFLLTGEFQEFTDASHPEVGPGS
jgi:hypothetical protein